MDFTSFFRESFLVVFRLTRAMKDSDTERFSSLVECFGCGYRVSRMFPFTFVVKFEKEILCRRLFCSDLCLKDHFLGASFEKYKPSKSKNVTFVSYVFDRRLEVVYERHLFC